MLKRGTHRQERVSRMRDRRGGGPDLSRALGELKRRGCSVLVVGDVPEAAIDRISARFLGRRPSRVRAFAVWGVGLDRLERRLRAAGPGREPALVAEAGASGARSVAATVETSPLPHLAVRTVEPSLDALAAAVETTTADARECHGPLDPADLRLCVDVFRGPADAADARALLDAVREVAVDAGGLAHVLVPTARTGDAVADLRPQFDVVVALRATNGSVEQRWTVAEYGVETGWTELTVD